MDEKSVAVSHDRSEGEKKNSTLQHSRSFKYSTHNRVNVSGEGPAVTVTPLDLGNSSNSSNGPASPVPEDCKVSEKLDSAYGTDSNRTASRNTESSHTFPIVEKSPTGSCNTVIHHNTSGSSVQDRSGSSLQADRLDGTHPDRSSSSLHNDRQLHQLDRSGSSLHNRSSSSAAFNNETYMSIDKASPEDQSYMSVGSPPQPSTTGPDHNHNNTYQSVHALSDSSFQQQAAEHVNTSQASRVTVISNNSASTPKRPQQDLLKRSPVLRDVTGFTPIPMAKKQNLVRSDSDKGKEKLHAPLTIIIPNISNQAVTKSSSASPDKWSDGTISLDVLNPGTHSRDISSFSSHDYENLALVNINRDVLNGAQHWRTYSDMANSRHDDSTKYEKQKLNFTSSSEYR